MLWRQRICQINKNSIKCVVSRIVQKKIQGEGVRKNNCHTHYPILLSYPVLSFTYFHLRFIINIMINSILLEKIVE